MTTPDAIWNRYHHYDPRDPLTWTKNVLADAIEWAEAEREATERARQYHLNRAIERGTCAVGHDFTDGPGQAKYGGECSYCRSVIAHSNFGW